MNPVFVLTSVEQPGPHCNGTGTVAAKEFDTQALIDEMSLSPRSDQAVLQFLQTATPGQYITIRGAVVAFRTR